MCLEIVVTGYSGFEGQTEQKERMNAVDRLLGLLYEHPGKTKVPRAVCRKSPSSNVSRDRSGV